MADEGEAGRYPVSIQQENRLLRETNLGNGVIKGFSDFVTVYIPIPGESPRHTIERALHLLVTRHEAIRTSFHHDDGDFYQHVNGPEEIELTERVAPREDSAIVVLKEVYEQPFAPDTNVFLRAVLLRHRENAATLVLVTEHLVVDEAACHILRSEFEDIWRALKNGEDVAADAGSRMKYRFWATAQRAALRDGAEEQSLAFWKATLGSAGPFPPAKIFHPLDGVERAPLAYVEQSWGEQKLRLLQELSRRYRMSRFMTLLACVQIAIAITIEEDAVVVHSATANRTTDAARTMVGWCAHGLPFRLELPSGATVETAMLASRTASRAVFGHQDLPLTRIVRALAPAAHGSARALRPPRFYFGYYEQVWDPALDFIRIEESEVRGGARWAQPGLSIDVAVAPTRVDLRFHFGEGRMNADVVAGIGGTLTDVLEHACATPQIALGALGRSGVAGARL